LGGGGWGVGVWGLGVGGLGCTGFPMRMGKMVSSLPLRMGRAEEGLATTCFTSTNACMRRMMRKRQTKRFPGHAPQQHHGAVVEHDKHTDGPAEGGSKFAAAASKVAGAPLVSCRFVSMDASAKPSFSYGSSPSGWSASRASASPLQIAGHRILKMTCRRFALPWSHC